MKALITGATGGIGLDFARFLSELGYDLVLVARNKEKLNELKDTLNTNVEVIPMDLSIEKNVYKLYNMNKGEIELLINNAGFGVGGSFLDTDLDKELNMIDLNIKTYHILMKLFLKDFEEKNRGRILNVASSAAFQPGPLLASYYATKSYIYSLSMAVYEELRRKKSNVKISILCPGPVDTGFSDRANINFKTPLLESYKVVEYALKQMFNDKLIIIPGTHMKIGVFLNRLLPRKTILKLTYEIQKPRKKS